MSKIFRNNEFKIKNSGVHLSKEKDLKDLKNNNDNDIQDFIILPKKTNI